MRWIIRHVVFVLCLGLGTTAWYIVAQKRSTPASAAPANDEIPVNLPNPQLYAEGLVVSTGQSFKFGPVEPMSGLVNARTVVLRESPAANSSVVAKLKLGDYVAVQILGSTRDFLHVRFGSNETMGLTQVTEGWTTWGSVVPDMSAFVLDAETGEVVAQIPLDDGITSAIFSPDGSRAIFSSGSDSLGRIAYEMGKDYTLRRSLTAPNDDYFSTLFYGPGDGALYATLHPSGGPGNEGVNLVRIGDDGSTSSIPMEIERSKTGFVVVSPDGLLGFRRRIERGEQTELVIDVFELTTLTLRNTFKLSGSNWPSDAGSYILSRDGSELYIRVPDNNGTVLVVDTRNGQPVRELSASATQGWSYFSQRDLIGDSILFGVWETGEDEMHSRQQKFWISNGRRMLAEPGIDSAVDAAGKRYAVNEEGTLLFGLDDNNRIQTRRTIARPDRGTGATMGNDLRVFGLIASPDGKRLIMFLGFEHGC